MTYYLHQVPGRIRIRIPAIRHNRSKAAEVKNLFNFDGIEKVEVNHLTGSVVVMFNPEKLNAQFLLDALSEKGYFDKGRAITCDQYINRTTSAAGAKAGRLFFGWAVGKALEANGLSLLAAFI
jgi:hypothetical protein